MVFWNFNGYKILLIIVYSNVKKCKVNNSKNRIIMIRKKLLFILKIIFFGGFYEIGKNICIFEYDDEIIIFDGGLGFFIDGMYGVNIVLLDVIYLCENCDKIKGMIVIYGYEDYIGGIFFYLKNIEIFVIYGFKLVMVLFYYKLEEVGV